MEKSTKTQNFYFRFLDNTKKGLEQFKSLNLEKICLSLAVFQSMVYLTLTHYLGPVLILPLIFSVLIMISYVKQKESLAKYSFYFHSCFTVLLTVAFAVGLVPMIEAFFWHQRIHQTLNPFCHLSDNGIFFFILSTIVYNSVVMLTFCNFALWKNLESNSHKTDISIAEPILDQTA